MDIGFCLGIMIWAGVPEILTAAHMRSIPWADTVDDRYPASHYIHIDVLHYQSSYILSI